MRVICLDVGDKRVGVAVTDPLNLTAQAVETLVIQSVLNSALSRITGEKLLRLRNADPAKVMEQEKRNDEMGLHPMIPPLDQEG